MLFFVVMGFGLGLYVSNGGCFVVLGGLIYFDYIVLVLLVVIVM